MSLLFHGLLLTKCEMFLTDSVEKEKISTTKTTEIEITPETIKKIIKNKPQNTENIKPLPYLENFANELNKRDNPVSLKKPQIFKKNIKEVFFSETPQNNNELQKNNAYMDYYRLIREKIKANAYHSYNSTREGEILVNFLILNNGSLQDIAFDQKSANSNILKKITVNSIQKSSPFPAFPDELKQYSQLRFNISIYFRNN